MLTAAELSMLARKEFARYYTVSMSGRNLAIEIHGHEFPRALEVFHADSRTPVGR